MIRNARDGNIFIEAHLDECRLRAQVQYETEVSDPILLNMPINLKTAKQQIG